MFTPLPSTLHFYWSQNSDRTLMHTQATWHACRTMEHEAGMRDDTWTHMHVFRCLCLAGGTSDYSLWFPLARLVVIFTCVLLIYIYFGSSLQGPLDSASDAVRLPLHNCGNFEWIGIHHHASQTLFLSDLINVPNCKDPTYGKLHIRLYMSILHDMMNHTSQQCSYEDSALKSSLHNHKKTENWTGLSISSVSHGPKTAMVQSNFAVLTGLPDLEEIDKPVWFPVLPH
jgi:hypothetical protein